jgi:hypothetical protein
VPCNGGHTYSPPDHTSCEEYEKALVDENDQLTRLLCYLCGRLTGEDKFKNMPKQLTDWWKKHQRLDHKRVARQMDALLLKNKGVTNASVLSRTFIEKAEKAHPLSAYHAHWLFFMAKAAVARYAALDAKKKRAEAKLARALAKLTPKERELLGVKLKRRKK